MATCVGRTGREFFKQCAALVLAGAALLPTFLIGRSRTPSVRGVLPETREYYLYSASSQAYIAETYGVEELFSVTGECVKYTFDARAQATAFAEKLRSSCAASVRFVEEVCGVVSYYCYSPRLGDGVRLNGKTVNLHIAVRTGEGTEQGGASVAVGSPLIFGGY